MSRLLFAVALALTACSGAPKPAPIAAAEAACLLEVEALIRSGACDDYERAIDCPAFLLTEIQCKAWLDEAVRQESK